MTDTEFIKYTDAYSEWYRAKFNKKDVIVNEKLKEEWQKSLQVSEK